jgi:drug/metabolite transporter (DMT)-like permease
MLPAFLTTILFSISAVCGRRVSRFLGGTEANLTRLVLAAVVLGVWAHGFGLGLGGAGWWFFFVSGCVGFGFGDLALFQALPRIGSRLSVLLVQCLAAPCAALTEWLWLGTTLTLPQLAGGLTILIGVAIALAPARDLGVMPKDFRIGVAYGVVGALCQGWGAVLSRKAYDITAQAGGEIDGVNAAYQRLLGGILISGVFLCWLRWRAAGKAREPSTGGAVHRWRLAWPWVIVNGLAGPALGVSCYQWALSTTPTGVVLPIVAITPLVVIPFARVMEGDQFTFRSLVGGIIAVAGVVTLTLVR